MDKERFPDKKAVEKQKADLSGADLKGANLYWGVKLVKYNKN